MAGEDDNIETPPPNNHTGGQVHLPTFWAQAPAMWFAQAECLFQLQGVTCQVKKYCYVVASLNHESKDRSGGGDRKKSWTRKKEKSDGQGPSLTAWLESGLCHAHWVYGASATTCHKPCTWQGNGKAGGN
jgi:hypothetical protein